MRYEIFHIKNDYCIVDTLNDSAMSQYNDKTELYAFEMAKKDCDKLNKQHKDK